MEALQNSEYCAYFDLVELGVVPASGATDWRSKCWSRLDWNPPGGRSKCYRSSWMYLSVCLQRRHMKLSLKDFNSSWRTKQMTKI